MAQYDHIVRIGTSPILLNTGRPVLVVPDGITKDIGERVLIAWKDSGRHDAWYKMRYHT